jgi:DNA-binding CsgD family transcriptional regulator
LTGQSSITEQDLKRMLDVVSAEPVAPEGAELPDEVLRGLVDLIPAATASYTVMDPHRAQVVSFQEASLREFPTDDPDTTALYFEAYWQCPACHAPELARGPGVAARWLDFYSEREFRSLRLAEYFRHAGGVWHDLVITLPSSRGLTRMVALLRDRDDGPFTERDRLVLTLLRPHLAQLRDRVAAGRRTVPALTPRQLELLRRVSRGDTNRRIARDLAVSEGTVRKHLENIYARLDVHSRTEALARASDLLTG